MLLTGSDVRPAWEASAQLPASGSELPGGEIPAPAQRRERETATKCMAGFARARGKGLQMRPAAGISPPCFAFPLGNDPKKQQEKPLPATTPLRALTKHPRHRSAHFNSKRVPQKSPKAVRPLLLEAVTAKLFSAAVTHRRAPASEDLTAQEWQIIGFNLSLRMYLQLGPVAATDRARRFRGI